MNARPREGEPSPLKIRGIGHQDVGWNRIEANLRLKLGARGAERQLGGEAEFVKALDRDFGEVQRRVQVQADDRRVQLVQGADDWCPSLRELGGRVDDDGDLVKRSRVLRAVNGAANKLGRLAASPFARQPRRSTYVWLA